MIELAGRAHAGQPTLLTLYDQPYAAIVSAGMVNPVRPRARFLALRGSGKGLWDAAPTRIATTMRDEWSHGRLQSEDPCIDH